MGLASFLGNSLPFLRNVLFGNMRHTTVAALTIPFLTIASWWTASYLTSPLRRYPGPFLAGFTNWWRFFQVLTGDYHTIIHALHAKYGPVVRIGPNLLDIDHPQLIKTIYGTDGKWRKTEFYHNNSAIVNGEIVYHLFSETDQRVHAQLKRPMVKYYSLGNVMKLEPLMDTVITDFCGHLDKNFEETGRECNLGEWIAFYSWDMNGAASFSKRFGYMDEGHDFDGTIELADRALDYFTAVGQIPWLDFLLDKNPIMRIGPPNLANITRIALGHLTSRLGGENPGIPDFLQNFINAKNDNPNLVDDGVIMGYLLVNLLAGADTTAITIRSIFYNALRKPDVYRRLEEEVCAAGFGSIAPFKDARALPYLEAVIREGMRMHPGVSMLLERYVPDGGLALPDGTLIPARTAVGINPYVMGRNKSVYGDDTDDFRPERWLRCEGESEDDFALRMRVWNAADLTFGAGSRVCIGRHLAAMEVYKIVATLVSRYHVEIVDPTSTWKVIGSWFPRQKGGLACKLRKREGF